MNIRSARSILPGLLLASCLPAVWAANSGALVLSANAVDLGSQALNTVSAAQTITISVPASTTITLNTVGVDSDAFSITQSGATPCPKTVVGASATVNLPAPTVLCTYAINFVPTKILGYRRGNLMINYNQTSTSQNIPSGTFDAVVPLQGLAVDATGASLQSSLAPGAPIMSATAGNGSAIVTLSPNITGSYAIQSYTVTVTCQDSAKTTKTAYAAATSGQTTVTVNGLPNGNVCTVAATEFDGYQNSSAATTTVTPVQSLFNPPTNLNVSTTSTGAAVTFAAPAGGSTGTLSGYTVTWTPAGGMDQNLGASANVLTHNISGLSPSTAYTFTVTANYANPTGTASASKSATTADQAQATPPGTPTNVQATASDSSAVVTFSAPSPGTITGGGSATISTYTVTSNPAGGVDSGGPSTTHTITGLTNGTAYTFTVVATNNAGQTSSPSTQSNSVTPSRASITCDSSKSMYDAHPSSLEYLSAGVAKAYSFTQSSTGGLLAIQYAQSDNYATVSTTPCDFNVQNIPAQCQRISRMNDTVIYLGTTGISYMCPVVQGQKYYLNIRTSIPDGAGGWTERCPSPQVCGYYPAIGAQ